MRHMLASVVFFVLAASGSALAAAAPLVPTTPQRELKALLVQIGAPDLALVPTSRPAHFAYESYSVTGSPPGLNVSLIDQRFVKAPQLAVLHAINYDSAYFKGGLGNCSSGSRKTFHVGGGAVYSDGTTVWRCVLTSRGRVVRTSADGRLAESALATFVASVRPVR